MSGKFFCSIRADVWPVVHCIRMASCQLKDDFGVYSLFIRSWAVKKKSDIKCYNLFFCVVRYSRKGLCPLLGREESSTQRLWGLITAVTSDNIGCAEPHRAFWSSRAPLR